jgi:hypothetical protein
VQASRRIGLGKLDCCVRCFAVQGSGRARPDGPTGAIGAVSAACEKVGEIVLLSAQVYIRSPPGSLFEGLILYKKVLYSASTGAYL